MGECPYQAELTDPVLNEMFDDWRTRRALFDVTHDSRIHERLCKDFGLYEWPHIHIELEAIYAKWKTNEQEKSMRQARATRQRSKRH